jgi:F0F1-type ATP synthase assembly protein I
MSEQSNEPGNFPPPRQKKSGYSSGESQVWSIIGTLVAGPAVWGFVGLGVDRMLNVERTFTAVGVIVGFLTSLYIVYIRYGRG